MSRPISYIVAHAKSYIENKIKAFHVKVGQGTKRKHVYMRSSKLSNDRHTSSELLLIAQKYDLNAYYDSGNTDSLMHMTYRAILLLWKLAFRSLLFAMKALKKMKNSF